MTSEKRDHGARGFGARWTATVRLQGGVGMSLKYQAFKGPELIVDHAFRGMKLQFKETVFESSMLAATDNHGHFRYIFGKLAGPVRPPPHRFERGS